MCDSDEDWSDIENEVEDDQQKCPCPFCDEVQPSADDTLSHCSSKHALNLLQYKLTMCIDTYGWIKLINYIRKENVASRDLSNISSPPFPWDDSLYLQPALLDDPLLQYDFDEDDAEKLNKTPFEVDTTPDRLKQRLRDMEQKVKESEDRLQKAYEDMDKMRQAMNEILLEDKMTDKRSDCRWGKNEEEDENGYFATYSHYSIHEEMLKDRVRMESYHLFISRNPELFKDKVVLDVGCGTGILSLMAVKSGASHVIAIDQSQIIYKAIEIARENNLSSKISFIRGRVEEVTLPVDKVDIIISEWMGYMLLFESMMDTVLFARDKWLKDCRQVYPNNCSISLAAIGDEYEYQNTIKFWDSIEGFEMSCMKQEVLKEARVMLVDEYSLISSADVLKKFDLSVVKPSELEFESHFLLTMLQNTSCHAIVVYFDIGFEVHTYRVYFSTSPQDTPTHWKQTVLFLEHPLKVQTGDVLRGVFKCCRDNVDHRSIIIKLSMKLSSLHTKDSEESIVIEQSYMIC